MSIPYNSAEKLAGILVIASFLFFIGAIIFVGGGRNWFLSHNQYYALYKEGYNLSPGVKVKFLRTDIGYVYKVELTDNNMVAVSIKILEEYADRVRTDSKAAIESPTIIGSEYIDIIPGSNDAPLIPNGGQIPAGEKKSLDDMLADLRLEEKMKIIEDIMLNVESLTAQLKDPKGPLLGTMANVQKLTDQIVAGEGSLGAIVSNEDLYNSLKSLMAELDATAKNLTYTSGELKQSLPTILTEVEHIIKKLEIASRQAPDISREARESMRDVNQVLDAAKKNILIRGKLAPAKEPKSIELSTKDN